MSSSQHAQESSSSQPQIPPQTFCKADYYLSRLVPGHISMSESELKDLMREFGATDDNMQRYIDCFDANVEDYMGPGGPGFRMIGLKPTADDPNVFTVPIPNTDLVIRMWDGGMEHYGQYCLDFYDIRRDTAVNLPQDFSLWPAGAHMAGSYMMHGPLPSWETAMSYSPDRIPAGEEKWSVPAGSYITLKRSARPQDDFTFAIPVRQLYAQTIVQPTRGPVHRA